MRFFILVAILFGVFADKPVSSFKLTVLHTNDVHARVLEINKYNNDCREKDRKKKQCYGGVARRSTVIKKIRSEIPNILLLDGGDQFQGSLFYTQFKGVEAFEFMNRLGYDAMAVGNHEFDDGPENLARFAREAKFPVLSANIDVSQEPLLKNLVKPFTIIEVDGQKIGVIGMTTEDTKILSKPGEKIKFLKIESEVKKNVSILEARGINKILVVSHSGFARDRNVAKTVAGIDMIVSGHTNTFLSNTDPEAEGPYPWIEKSPRGEPVLIVSAHAYGKYLGQLGMTFDSNGVLETWEGEPILLDHTIAKDETALEKANELNSTLLGVRTKLVGFSSTHLNGDSKICRFEECNFGNLLSDAFLWVTRKEGTEIAVMNAGGIRGSLEKGKVFLGGVLEALPFANTLSTFKLKGSDLIDTLEVGVSRAHDSQLDGTGRFLQLGGLKMTWTPSKPRGQRVLEVKYRDREGQYQALDPKKTYKMVTNAYIRRGGDGFKVLKEKAIDPYDFGPTISEAFLRYLEAKKSVSAKVEGRLTKKMIQKLR